MKRSACLIFNPVAGQSDPDQDLAQIRDLLEPEIDLDICMTTAELGADELARAAVARGVETIIASGGDGTLSAASEALVGTDIPFGIISRGTANAFAAALGIPDNIPAACQTILGGVTRLIDAAYCNDRPMLLLAGIGFEAEMVEHADRDAKDRLGVLAYVLAGLQQLRNLEHFETIIETEDQRIELTAAAVTVANAAPATSILAQGPAAVVFDDGLLDVTIAAPNNLPAAIAASYTLLRTALTGNPVNREDVGYLRSRWIKITTNPAQKVVLDGEIIGTTPIEVKCIPQGLRVFVPFVEATTVTSDQKLEGLPNLVIENK